MVIATTLHATIFTRRTIPTSQYAVSSDEAKQDKVTKALKVIKLKEDARLIANAEFFGIFNIAFIRSRVNNFVYLVFNLSSFKGIIYGVSFKNKEVMGVRILSADKNVCVLGGAHRTGLEAIFPHVSSAVQKLQSQRQCGQVGMLRNDDDDDDDDDDDNDDDDDVFQACG